ncbi:MAG: OsmC family protein [Pseudomonadota bacterium]
MASYVATVDWTLTAEPGDFLAGRYSRAHAIGFDGGLVVPGSPAASSVPAPWSVEAAADPEELLVAAVSNCHMLWFLHKAREAGFVVARYRDRAEGVMRKNAEGRLAITRVTLRPEVAFAGEPPDAARLEALHHAAHEDCFIANSIRAEVVVEGPR